MSQSILVIDDNQDFLASITMLLRARGFEVHAAESGTDGLKMLEELSPAVVITDLNMPKPDGFDIATSVMESRSKPSLFIMSGLPNSPIYFRVAEQLGAERCFQKPVDMQMLCDAVAREISRQ